MPSLNLTAEQSRSVDEALREAFPSDAELARMCYYSTNQQLNDLVGEGHPAPARVFLLLQATEAAGLTKELLEGAVKEKPANAKLAAVVKSVVAGFVPPAPHAYMLADRSQFDLTDLDQAYWRATRPTPGVTRRLVGFGVSYSDDTFIRLVSERLLRLIGQDPFPQEPFELNPKRTPARIVIKNIGALKRVLDNRPVLYVVRANEADDESIADLWKGISDSYRDPPKFLLIVIIVKEGANAFPADLARLPAPKFEYNHLVSWATQVVEKLRWEPRQEWADAWSNRLLNRLKADDALLPDDTLDARLVYDHLAFDIEELKMNEKTFRLSLKKD